MTNAITHIKPVQRVVAKYTKADEYLGQAQKVANHNIRNLLHSDLSHDHNADQLAYWRAELAGVRKLQAIAIVIRS